MSFVSAGTTILLAGTRDSVPRDRECFFEPRTAAELAHGRVIARFHAMVLIVRDSRDQFISRVLYYTIG